jgi:hypothetical protein
LIVCWVTTHLCHATRSHLWSAAGRPVPRRAKARTSWRLLPNRWALPQPHVSRGPPLMLQQLLVLSPCLALDLYRLPRHRNMFKWPLNSLHPRCLTRIPAVPAQRATSLRSLLRTTTPMRKLKSQFYNMTEIRLNGHSGSRSNWSKVFVPLRRHPGLLIHY